MHALSHDTVIHSRQLSMILANMQLTGRSYPRLPAIVDVYPRSSTVIAVYLRLPRTTGDNRRLSPVIDRNPRTAAAYLRLPRSTRNHSFHHFQPY
jgi:hypothetical protein